MPGAIDLPGPWGFLQDIGDAGKQIIDAQTQARLRQQQQDTQRAQMLQQLITSGAVDPTTLQANDPGATSYYRATNIDPRSLSNAPFKIKQNEATKSNQDVQVGQVNLDELQRKAKILAGLTDAQRQQMMGIPTTVDLQSQDDKNLENIAARYVYTARGNIDAAMVAAEHTLPGDVNKKLTRDYFGRAATEYANEQRKLQIEMTRAMKENPGTSIIGMLDDQMRQNNAEINALHEVISKYTVNGTLPQGLSKEAKTEIDNAKSRITSLTQRNSLLASKFDELSGVGGGANDKVTRTKAALAAGTITVNDVNKSGLLTADEKKQVLAGYTPIKKTDGAKVVVKGSTTKPKYNYSR